MATSGAAGYVPNVHHPEVMRSILAQIVETGDVIGPAGHGRPVLAVTVDNWLIEELATIGADIEDSEQTTNDPARRLATGGPGAIPAR